MLKTFVTGQELHQHSFSLITRTGEYAAQTMLLLGLLQAEKIECSDVVVHHCHDGFCSTTLWSRFALAIVAFDSSFSNFKYDLMISTSLAKVFTRSSKVAPEGVAEPLASETLHSGVKSENAS